MMLSIPLGRAVIDIESTALTPAERARLLHPQVGGIILFTRNYASVSQLATLCEEIHGLRNPPLLIAVDHEGGRVQRFRDGFTQLPPMAALGRLWDRDEDGALGAARACGLVLATELRACGVDLSFAPVLDLDAGICSAIGERGFHRDADAVSVLAAALQQGMADAGMAACGKHFPGHGHVATDSHHDVPVDDRALAELEQVDLVPFRCLIAAGLAAIMPAHVIYPQVDGASAGFSSVWLRYLRQEMGFDGVLFSDDLSMEGARDAGGPAARGLAALRAGCDMVLLCNDGAAADALLAGLALAGIDPVPPARMKRLVRRTDGRFALAGTDVMHYRQALAIVLSIEHAESIAAV
jgi:beta-N-acetylhexosaminidase